jgi:beta-1,4-N-acetylglucosaminyltransferase
MKIFVTVGHTRFDSLFRQIDHINNSEWHFISQVYDGCYVPENGDSISFTSNIHKYFEVADLVITHAGAGTVYTLLELAKPTIVIANTDRVDSHQEDLLKYVEDNKFALVCRDLSELEFLIEQFGTFEPKSYVSEPFLAANEISHMLGLID